MSQPSRTQLLAEVYAAQRAFAQKVRDLQKSQVSYIDRAPDLEPALLEASRIHSNRAALLNSLPRHGVVAEVGGLDAGSSRQIAEALCPGSLHIFATEAATARIQVTEIGFDPALVQIHTGDVLDRLARMARDTYDVVCLRGDPAYPEMLRGLVGAEHRLKAGGLLVVSDYTVWSVSSMSRSGVARAVNEFANNRRWMVVGLALQSAGFYDLCLRKPD